MKFLLPLLVLAVNADPGVTTHVLDTAIGLPGVGVKVNVYYQRANRPLDNEKWELIRSVHTNNDGRTDAPVVDTDEFTYLLSTSDQYFKLEFDLAAYYTQEVFFPQAQLVFKVKQEQVNEHFHVPILCTPYSYSTYRGS